MSNGNIEQFLEVFVSYTALSPNSPKVIEEEKDGTKVQKALVKIPVSGLDYHDTIVSMLENEKYQDMRSYFQLSHIAESKELFEQEMHKITKNQQVHITTDRKHSNLFLQFPVETANNIINQFQTDIKNTYTTLEPTERNLFATKLDLKMKRFVEHFMIQNYLDRIYEQDRTNVKVKKYNYPQNRLTNQ